jgi:putative DNA primase/helicase
VTVDTERAVYDRLIPDWQKAPLTSGNRRVRCPLHDDQHASMDIHEERGVWICRAGCGSGGAVAFARRVLGDAGARELLRELGDGSEPGSDRRWRQTRRKAEDAGRDDERAIDAKIAARIERLRAETVADDGTISGYLKARGLAGDVPAALRLHRALKYWTNDGDAPVRLGTFPAIVAEVQRLDGRVAALHRIYLAPDRAGKADVPEPKKLTPAIYSGATNGAAIHLAEPTDGRLALTEGIETGLAVMQATGMPTWACVSAGGLAAVELPPDVGTVEIWADREASGAGVNAAANAAARLHADGRTVHVIAPEGEDDDWLDVLVRDGAEALRVARALAEPWAPGSDRDRSSDQATAHDVTDDRVEIELGADEHRVNDAALAALTTESTIYARAHRLVRVVRPPRSGTPTIQVLPPSSLRELLTRRVRFVHEVKGMLVPAHPPDWCVAALAARAELASVRYLAGIAVAPTMRPDGTIMDQRGYDAATGLLLEPTGDVLPVPDRPTRDEARAAAEVLLEVVSDFPFALPAHRSAWLASVLTGFTRHAIPGNVPGVVVDANARGSGKGLLVDTIAIITTGHPISRSPQPKNDDELRKHITAAAIADTPAILIDNVTGKFSYPSFDAAITCNGLWSDRILCRSERRVLPLNTVWFVTSNNAALSSDSARRMLPIRLLSQVEHPEDRRDFRHSDLLAWTTERRPRLAQSALTVLRAYHVAGRPAATNLESWGSFEAWSALIRQCVVWLALPDPLGARAELRERADVDRDAIRTLLVIIDESFKGAEITAAELMDRSAALPELRAALDELCPPRPGEERPTVQRIGVLLRSLRDRVVDGRRLEGRPGHAGAAHWRVTRPNSDDGFDTHHTHHPHQGNGECGEDGEDGEDATRRGGDPASPAPEREVFE